MSGSRAAESTGAALLLAASRHPLSRACASGLARCGADAGGRLALLVSGGGDSMAMMLLVAAIRERSDPSLDSLAVLTIDHGLRAEAGDECASALALARRLGIARAACVRVAVERGGNMLDRARAARLAAARAFTEQHACAAAVAAHTADDRAESLVMGLRRGLGLAALARLRPSRTFADGTAPTILRPLLSVRRAELRAFLAELGVSWHDDPSNAQHDRGAIRTDPTLAALVDDIAAGASRLADEACDLVAFRDAEIERRIGADRTSVPRAEFDQLPQPLRMAALAAMVRAAGGQASAGSLDRAAEIVARGDRAPARFDCGSGVVLAIDAREVAAFTSEGSPRRSGPPRT